MTLFRTVRNVLRAQGPLGLLRGAQRRVLAPRAPCFDLLRPRVEGRAGLELGGPSGIFARRGQLPVYPLVAGLDNITFRRDTVWSPETPADRFVFDPHRPAGRQWFREATRLDGIADQSYDVLLSAHTLEHVANPLAALAEWRRVLRPGGTLVLVLPDRERTFDHRRPVTALAHLVDDRERGTGEDDLTHLPEILELHDLDRDPEAGDRQRFSARSERNLEFRCLHHHVFDLSLAAAAVVEAGFRAPFALESVAPDHLIVLAEKAGASGPASSDQ